MILKLNLTGRMVAYFLLTVLISAIGFGFVYYNLQVLLKEVTNVYNRELPRLAQTNEIAYNSLGQMANVRGYLLTGEEQYIQDYKRAAEMNTKIAQELLDSARVEQLIKAISEIKDMDDKYSRIVEQQVIPLKRAGKHDEALKINGDLAAPIARELTNKVNAYRNERTKRADTDLLDAVKLTEQAMNFVIVSALLSVICGIGIGIFGARNIVKPVQALVEDARKVADGDLRLNIEVKRHDEIGHLEKAFSDMVRDLRVMIHKIADNAQQVAASSEELTAVAEQSAQATNQIAASVMDVARGTDQQVSAVTDASAVIEQLSTSIKMMANSAITITNSAEQASSSATAGVKTVDTAVKQMANIERTVNTSAQVVVKLGERSKEIGQIVSTISGIAGQTNLLALNAAIEAARAGEQGRGFAVVAEEVRKLAEQAQESAKQIAKLIGEIQGDTDKAVVAMEEGMREVKVGSEVVNAAGEAFHEIVGIAGQVSAESREGSAAIQQMAGASQQVVSSIRVIEKISKENAGQTQTVSAATEEQSASIEEIASSSEGLSKMAQDLQDVTSKFKV